MCGGLMSAGRSGAGAAARPQGTRGGRGGGAQRCAGADPRTHPGRAQGGAGPLRMSEALVPAFVADRGGAGFELPQAIV